MINIVDELLFLFLHGINTNSRCGYLMLYLQQKIPSSVTELQAIIQLSVNLGVAVNSRHLKSSSF